MRYLKKYKLVGKVPVICQDDEIDTSTNIICRDVFGGTTVSTVFLSFDHSFGSDVPILFESMIFGGEHDGEQQRYTNYDDAVVGHQSLCDMVNRVSIERNDKLNNLGI